MLNFKLKKLFYKCTFCNKSSGYSSIQKDLGNKLNKFGFPHKLKDFETLSYKTYKCINCGSSDRDRLYKIYIDKFEKFTKKSDIVDFAPSALFEKYMRSRPGQYRTADMFIKNVDDNVDITDMKKYKDQSFDFFICSHILEHVTDDKKALNELHRILKNGGKGILMTPIINKTDIQDEDPTVTNTSERWRRFAQDDHVRLYEKSEFLNRVKDAGFNITVYSYRNLGIWNIIRNGIYLKSRLYVVTKG